MAVGEGCVGFEPVGPIDLTICGEGRAECPAGVELGKTTIGNPLWRPSSNRYYQDDHRHPGNTRCKEV